MVMEMMRGAAFLLRAKSQTPSVAPAALGPACADNFQFRLPEASSGCCGSEEHDLVCADLMSPHVLSLLIKTLHHLISNTGVVLLFVRGNNEGFHEEISHKTTRKQIKPLISCSLGSWGLHVTTTPPGLPHTGLPHLADMSPCIISTKATSSQYKDPDGLFFFFFNLGVCIGEKGPHPLQEMEWGFIHTGLIL